MSILSKKLDILFGLDHSIDVIGGAQKSLKIIIDALNTEYNMGVLQPGKFEEGYSNINRYGITEYSSLKEIVKHPFTLLKYIKNLRDIIKKENPRVIHTHSQVNFFIIAFLKKIRLLPKNTFLIHTERGLYTKYSNFINKLFLYLMTELNILVTTTNFNMIHWKKALKEKNIKLDGYEIIENTAGEIFEEYDKNYPENYPNSLVVGFAGRYADWKDWPLAVEISKKLNEKFADKLIIKMAVSGDDEKTINKIREMFNELEDIMGERFEGKINVAFEEMNSFYYDIDFFILTSIKNSESFGRTLVEAMSRKTIILTTDAGGSVEVVGNPNFVINNAETFVKRINEIYSNPEVMVEEKERSYNRVKEKYSLANNINKHREMYNKILKKD